MQFALRSRGLTLGVAALAAALCGTSIAAPQQADARKKTKVTIINNSRNDLLLDKSMTFSMGTFHAHFSSNHNPPAVIKAGTKATICVHGWFRGLMSSVYYVQKGNPDSFLLVRTGVDGSKGYATGYTPRNNGQMSVQTDAITTKTTKKGKVKRLKYTTAEITVYSDCDNACVR